MPGPEAGKGHIWLGVQRLARDSVVLYCGERVVKTESTEEASLASPLGMCIVCQKEGRCEVRVCGRRGYQSRTRRAGKLIAGVRDAVGEDRHVSR